jgi:predicted permease
MRLFTILKLRLRTLLKSRRLDRELEEELRYHIDLEVERNMKAGMRPLEARRAAMLSFGGASQIQEECRDERRAAWFTGIGRDLQYALRNLRRMPGFATAVVVTLGLGIGANTGVFSIADALLFRALPLPQPERLFQVLQPDGPGLTGYGELFSIPDFADMRDRVASYADLGAQTEPRQTMASADGSQEESIRRVAVSEHYFAVLGIEAAIGRGIGSEGGAESSQTPLAVISYGWWKRRFDADPSVLGRTIRVGKTIFQIAGVAQAGFAGIDLGTPTDLWTPLAVEPARTRSVRSIRIIGRLKTSATMAQAAAPLQAVLHQRMVEMVGRAPTGSPQSLINRILGLEVKLIPAGGGISPVRGEAGRPLFIVFGLVGLGLLMACGTVGTLFEARHSARQGEMAVRMSMGAGRWRLIRQLLTEALLLAGAAGVVGFALARVTQPILLALLTPFAPQFELPPRADGHVLAFTAAIGGLAMLLFALGPAWRSSAVNPAHALRSSTRLTSSGRVRRGRLPVVLQVSISMVLVLGAGAFARTLIHLSRINTGFDRQNVIVAGVRLRSVETEQRTARVWKELQERVSAIPGVESASLSSGSPFDGTSGNGLLRIPGVASNNQGSLFFLASPGFFQTTGMRIVQGRDFEARDLEPGAAPVALVSESLARQAFSGTSPIGRTFSNLEDSPPRWVTIMGVVRDIKFGNLRDASPRVVYLPYTWPKPPQILSVVLRARRDVAALGGALRREAGLTDPDLAVGQITSQTQLIDESLTRERMLASVGVFFGGLAVLMAVIGIYGITSYSVSKRTQEIGIRMALGAPRAGVLAMILRESAIVVGAGAAVGLAISLAAERLVAALLFGARASDPATLLTAALFVLLVTTVAAFHPARRAANIDPMMAIRCEWGVASVETVSPLRPTVMSGSRQAEALERRRSASQPPSPRADARIFGDLVRHFFGRFFDKEALSPQGRPEAGVFQTLGLLIPPSGFICLLLMISNPHGWQLVGLRFLLICYCMIVMGVVMVFEWEALFPDRRDYLILTPLSLRPFTILAAKFAALGIFLAMFLGAVNFFGVLLWPGVEGSNSYFQVAGAHLAVMIAAGLFSALAIAALQGVLVTVFRGAAYRRISAAVQTVLMAGLILFLFVSPMMAMAIPNLCRTHSPFLHWIPPFWFAGLYEQMRPVVAHGSAQAGKTLAGLGSLAVRSIWIALALFTASFLPEYRRHARRALEISLPRPKGPGRIGRALSRAVAWLPGDPVETGVFHFIGQTISRSLKHRLFLATYAGFGAALAVMLVANGGGSVRAPLALSFVLVSGLRAAFNFPSDLRANWAFQVSETHSAAAYIRATRKWVMFFAVLPLFLLVVAIEAMRSPMPVVAFHFAFGVTMSMILMEALFLSFHKVPFTCSHFPGKVNLVFLSVLYVIGFTFYSSWMAQLEEWLWAWPLPAVLFFLVCGAGLVALWRMRERLRPSESGLEYEDDGNPAVRLLGLNE